MNAKDEAKEYSIPQVMSILRRADSMKCSVEQKIWIDQMTLGQLERFLNGKYDA